MGKVYLTNAFSINMLKEFPISVGFDKIDKFEFCVYLDEAIDDNKLINTIGHDSTISLINTLCGTNLQKNRISIKLEKGDRALVIMISERLEEGKVLSSDEIKVMYEQGKIGLYEVWIND